MSSFAARLHLPGKAKLPLNVEVDITGETMRVTTEGRIVAAWPLADMEAEPVRDGLRLRIDGEDLVLVTDQAAGLAAAVGVGGAPALVADKGESRMGAGLASDFNGSAFSELRYRDLKDKLATVAADLTSESVPPSDAFARWLKLLKELNERHGHGSIPTPRFCELNGELLALIPEPSRETVDA